jgi:hypothetical protein
VIKQNSNNNNKKQKQKNSNDQKINKKTQINQQGEMKK